MTDTTSQIYDGCGSSFEDKPLGVDVETHEANTYRIATQKFVYDVVSSHNVSEYAHSGLLDEFIRKVNGNAPDSLGNVEVSSIRLLGEDGNPRFTIFADGTTVFNGVTSKIALTDGETPSEKAEIAFGILRACSADWEATNAEVEATSSNYRAAYTVLSELSGRWDSASVETIATSAENREACSYISDLKLKVPTAVWNEGNYLADVDYVRKSVDESSANYRGSWTDWSAVPTASEEYPADITGNRKPLKNDYIIVQDASELYYVAPVNENLVGSELKEAVGTILPAGHIITEQDVITLKNSGVKRVTVYRNGVWKFRYTGTWVEGAAGKAKWSAESRISTVSFSDEQMATIDSGFTAADKSRHDAISVAIEASGYWNSVYTTVSGMSADWTRGGGVIEKVDSVYSTVSSTSSKWETVEDKLDLSSINYYTEAMWEALTHDDTSYGDVPYGFSLIYEDTTSQADPAYYGITTGILLLSDSATFSAGELTFGSADTFNTSTGTFTMYGSSINLGTFTVENYLTHAYNLNTDTLVNSGDPYAASIIAENGYYLDVVTCTMGGVSQAFDRERRRFDIASVNGNIIITATGAPTGGSAYYYVSSGAFVLPSGTSYLSSTGLLTFGSSVEYVSSTGIMTLNGQIVE